jgi:serine protease Do
MLAEPTIVAPDGLRVGQTAIAVGRAIDEHEPNVSVGIISALNRAGGRAIQTDANTSRNHYGGALIDIHGRLIGVVVPAAPLAGSIVANMDLYDSGIGFAIPAAQVYGALDRLKAGIDLQPGILGIGLEAATTIDAPAIVAVCRPNSDACRQGVRTGDRIVAIAGQPIDRHAQIGELLAPRYAGDSVAVTWRRGEQSRETHIELLAEIAAYEPPVIGILPARAAQLTHPEDTDDERNSGIVVRRIIADSPASDAGILPGDRITAVGDSAVADAPGLRSQLEEQRVGDTLTLSIERDNERLDVDVTLGGATTILGAGDRVDSTSDADTAAAAPFPDIQRIDIPGIGEQALFFSPGDDDECGQCGLVMWVSDKKDAELQESMLGWRDTCTRQRWTLVAVTMPGGPLGPTSQGRLPSAIEFCRDRFGTSSDRTVLVSHGGSVLTAWQTAISRADLCRGVMAIEPTRIGPVRELMPGRTFEVFLTTAGDAQTARRADAVVEQLRQWKYPVTVTTTAEPLTAPPVTPSEDMIRWFDVVDRL